MIKKFIKKTIFFFILTSLLFFSINMCYENFVLKKTLLAKTDAQFIDANKEGINILFLGASHTKRGINPLLIPNSFNYASADENYAETYYKLKTLIEKKQLKPQIIILPLELNSFTSKRIERFNNGWYWKKYIDFQEFAKFNPKFSILEAEITSTFPVLGNGLDFLSIIIKGKSEMVKGHKRTYRDFSQISNKEQEAIVKANSHFKNTKLIDERLVFYLKRILDLAKENNIKVLVIKFPITEEYYKASLRYIQDIEKFNDITEGIVNDRKDVILVDYQRLYWGNYSLFHNSDHLNAKGAEEFTQVIKKDIENILKEKNNNLLKRKKPKKIIFKE